MAADQGGAAPPPPPPPRRPRVREVSSRFMSPAAVKSSSSSPAPPIEKSSKPSPSQSIKRHQEPFSNHSSYDNIPHTLRSIDSVKSDLYSSTHRKKRSLKFLKENDQMQISSSTVMSSRPDTPTCAPTERIVPSRFRFPQRQTTSDAARLLQSTGLSFSSINNHTHTLVNESQPQISKESESISCPNSPISSQNNIRSRTSEDSLSTRLLLPSTTANSHTSSKFSTPSLCSRSLNLTISASYNSSKTGHTNYALPPQPTSTRPVGLDSNKTKKPHSSQEQLHSFKLLHNHYLLWRYANAKAEASMLVQRRETEKQFFSLGADISQLRDTVKRKKVELVVLQQINALSTILEAQMPYLDEWSSLEQDYTYCLSGTTDALTNSLLRLPVSGNVQVNIKEAAEALDSAVKTTEMISQHMQMFLLKAEEMDSLMTEVANVIDLEKSLVEECGNLLAKTYTMQVEDCSLQAHLMQLCGSKQ